MGDFFTEIVNILTNVTDAINDTADYLDDIDFSNTWIFEFMGYARYVLGDVNYVMLTMICIIAIGLSVWSFLLRAVGWLKNLLPW